ncbi:hypothetical protein OS493_023541 [Desmophyllum pertusum]|uniref:PABC domain-containing protein n=1 Tax=Desmophyllum pertusum TaxID=174260 RepID=A0A9W9ZDQ3_9CNID|nr:hypothetical protein OS493_023541 [Desmophyllum pertusum]
MQNGESESVLKQAKDKTSIGEELYELVCTFDSDQADKITGMLLEMDLKDLEIIVKNQTALEEKVNEALTALNGQFSKAETTTSSVDEQEDKTLHGEQLYYLISEWFPDDTDKITGMLLELDVTTLNSLLKDPEALKEKATHAANALSETNINKEIPHSLASTSNSIQECRDNTLSDSEMKPVLAEQLYNIIEEWYPGKAEQLTGMLMDVDCATLETLVLNEQMLKEKLEGALDAVYKTAQTVPDRESTKHHSEEEFTKEELGGKLYEKIEESHPEDADKITGMLLEMTVEDIERLLKNPQELQDKIQLAEKALE